MNNIMINNTQYQDEASQLFTDMLRIGVKSSMLVDIIFKIRDRANNDDEIMQGIRQLHEVVMKRASASR